MSKPLDIKDAARYLHVCTKTVRNRITAGDLQAYNHAGKLLLFEVDLEDYVRRHPAARGDVVQPAH